MTPFAKGHGTENDFVIVSDPDAAVAFPPERVAAVCDRRAGIGGDGLLRVVRAGALVAAGEIPALPEGVAGDDWFMDYRNADGSVAEMCGNGVRVFAHWLRSRGLVDTDEFTVGTRAGARQVRVLECSEYDARVSVRMGAATVTGVSTARMGDFDFAGLGVDVGNPHLAAVLPDADAATIRDLALCAPEFDPEFFPAGVNVEVLTPLSDGAVTMRVWERGVGETRSCGTGTVAAATAALADAGVATGAVTVRVPGGEVVVEIEETGERGQQGAGRAEGAEGAPAVEATLTGPSRIVATGEMVL
ncbi:diaminopimelate epimerase [Corynebacterium frankenforstense]|uniref:diaminopimelate epimerase n=1 Tax=Corynebacterium frankenforstense TaxID=1230998 RepID=UPI0009520D74|nr:diaminopimelate epimerase [Corynebacterium frankenforstense]